MIYYRVFLSLLLLPAAALHAQPITTAGVPAQLVIREAGAHSIRITLKPSGAEESFSPALMDRPYPAPILVLTQLTGPVKRQVGALLVAVSADPLTVTITTPEGAPIQQLVFHSDNTLSFALHDAPLLGMGEGGHKPVPGANWRQEPIEFDRRGRLQEMQPRWQSDAIWCPGIATSCPPCMERSLPPPVRYWMLDISKATGSST